MYRTSCSSCSRAVLVVVSGLVALFSSAQLAAQLAPPTPPKGWFLAGSKPKEYTVQMDNQVVHGGKASATMKFIGQDTSGFGTLMQSIVADNYLGKRVRLSAFVKTQNVSGWVGLWMRIDGGKNPYKSLAFDNMENRALRGTVDWKKCEVVLDVPAEAESLNWGLILGAKGQAWLEDVQIEIVGNDVPTTNMDATRKKEPVNLNFEQ